MNDNPIRHRRVNMSVPDCFIGAKVAHLPEGFLPEEQCSMLLVGPNGVGKSHAAAALANECNSQSLWSAKWAGVIDLMIWVRMTYRPGCEDSEEYILRDLEKPLVLVIDDLMAAKRSEHGLSVLLSVVNTRIENGLITIVTSDKGLERIEEWDSSLASRLGGFHVKVMTGPDRRIHV